MREPVGYEDMWRTDLSQTKPQVMTVRHLRAGLGTGWKVYGSIRTGAPMTLTGNKGGS
jgi:hypothetical protein